MQTPPEKLRHAFRQFGQKPWLALLAILAIASGAALSTLRFIDLDPLQIGSLSATPAGEATLRTATYCLEGNLPMQHSLIARGVIGHISLLRRADLQSHLWNSSKTLGKDILITWMDREILRLETQKTRLSDSETQFSLSVAFRTGNPDHPWAVFGLKAVGRSSDQAPHEDSAREEHGSRQHSLFALLFEETSDCWDTEVTVVS